MAAFQILLQKDVREQVRSSQLLIAVIMGVFFGILSPLAARYTPELLEFIGTDQGVEIILPEPGVVDALQQFTSNLGQIGLVVFVLLFMGSISREHESGTLDFLMTRPVRPVEILLSKAVVAVLVAGATVGASALATGFYTNLLFDGFRVGPFLYTAAYTFLYLASAAVLTVSMSAVVPRSFAAGTLAFGVWMAMAALGTLPRIGSFSVGKLNQAGIQAGLGGDLLYRPVIGAAVLVVGAFGLAVFRLNRRARRS
ncbi:MAG: ABC transporter permease [Spirochaetaceae bacterium]